MQILSLLLAAFTVLSAGSSMAAAEAVFLPEIDNLALIPFSKDTEVIVQPSTDRESATLLIRGTIHKGYTDYRVLAQKSSRSHIVNGRKVVDYWISLNQLGPSGRMRMGTAPFEISYKIFAAPRSNRSEPTTQLNRFFLMTSEGLVKFAEVELVSTLVLE
jgi:hypothetical protein